MAKKYIYNYYVLYTNHIYVIIIIIIIIIAIILLSVRMKGGILDWGLQDMSSDHHTVAKQLIRYGQVPLQFGNNFGICKIRGLD